MKEIIVKNLNSCYSEITILSNNEKHIVSNHGFFPLKYWVNYFENEYLL